MLESRGEDFVALLRSTRKMSVAAARAEVRASVDRLVHYAGWSDKFGALLSTVNPVASPYFNFSVPEPMGVVALVAPEEPELLGLVSHLAPAIVAGNSVVSVLSEAYPLAGLEFAEVLATSDLPAGVVNLVSGQKAELVPQLARHMDVNALELVAPPADLERSALQDAAVNVKRARTVVVENYAGEEAQGLDWIRSSVEIKTTWHPIGW